MSSYDTTRNAFPPFPGDIQAIALTWVQRRTAGLTPGEREQFRAWLAADERHAEAFAQANKDADEFDWPLHSGTIDEILVGLARRARKRRRRRVAAGIAAAAVLAATGTFWLQQRNMPNATSIGAPASPLTMAPASPSTEAHASPSRLLVMQPQQRILPDGSVVELKAGTVLTVSFTAAFRRVELKHGTAYFQVAKNPHRPFIVTANGIEARATGTAFSVRWGESAVEVLVTEGRVAVAKPISTAPATIPAIATPSTRMAHLVDVAAGHRVVVGLGPHSARPEVQVATAAELNRELSWRIPRLRFSGTPLWKVVAVMNKYATDDPDAYRLVLDPDLKNLRISGMLRADKVDALVTMLESDFAVQAQHRGDGTIALRRGR